MSMMDITRLAPATAQRPKAAARSYRLFYPSSWRPRLNPYAGLARAAAGAWFRQLGVVSDARSERIFDEERPDLYGGFPYPHANFETLTTVSKYLALWMLFDDLVTETVSTRELGPSVQDYGNALHQGTLPADPDPFLRAWWSLGRTFAGRMSPAWCRRVADYFIEWLSVTVIERETYTTLRSEDRLPDLQSYLDIRCCSVGALPTFYFIEHVDGFELPERVHDDPTMRALHSLGSKLIFLANDILGLEKDLRSGWPNLVTVLQQEHRLSLTDAIEHAVDLHNHDVLRFLALEQSLPTFGPEIDPFVKLYVERMHYVICGFAEFERLAERYRWRELGAGAFQVALCTFAETT